MSQNQTRVKYIGSVPGADANTYNLFTTVQNGFPRGLFPQSGVQRFSGKLNNVAACTLKAYYSNDGGTNWIQHANSVLAAPSAGTTNDFDFYVAEFQDWKLDLLNGGSAQTGFAPQMAMSYERTKSA